MAVPACAPLLAKMVSMTIAPFAADLHKVLSVPLLPALAPRGTLDQVSAKTAAQWWQPVISPFRMIIGTLVGAVVLRWVLHGAIDRIVDSALARVAAHESQTPRRTSRVLAQATGLDQARKMQRAATMGTS